MKKLSVKELEKLSKCCGSHLVPVVAGEGTSYFVCANCKKATDPTPSETNEADGSGGPGYAYSILQCKTDEQAESVVRSIQITERQRVVEMIEGMKVFNNVTIPVCNKCQFYGFKEDYCPKCGDNLVPHTATGNIEKVKNSLLSDLQSKLGGTK